ncbi:hypothetical protein ACHAWF_004895 [Thalassiosira exigua]
MSNDRDEDGNAVRLSKVALDILSDPERTKGAIGSKNPAKSILEKRYFERLEGEAGGEGVKFMCRIVGVIGSCYHIRSDPELLKENEKLQVAMRRFPCCFSGCLVKLAEPIETRYTGVSSTCTYWEFFKKEDGQSGYNDWALMQLETKPKGYREEDVLDRNAATVSYWTKEPWEVEEEDATITLENERFAVKEGDIVCKGKWLDTVLVPNSPRVYCPHAKTVVYADINLQALGPENELLTIMRWEQNQFARYNDALRDKGDDHKLLISEALRRGVFDHEEEVDVVNSDDDRSDSDDEYFEERED